MEVVCGYEIIKPEVVEGKIVTHSCEKCKVKPEVVEGEIVTHSCEKCVEDMDVVSIKHCDVVRYVMGMGSCRQILEL